LSRAAYGRTHSGPLQERLSTTPAATSGYGLITQRSQVQILSPRRTDQRKGRGRDLRLLLISLGFPTNPDRTAHDLGCLDRRHAVVVAVLVDREGGGRTWRCSARPHSRSCAGSSKSLGQPDRDPSGAHGAASLRRPRHADRDGRHRRGCLAAPRDTAPRRLGRLIVMLYRATGARAASANTHPQRSTDP
jgi:hypothetical protein